MKLLPTLAVALFMALVSCRQEEPAAVVLDRFDFEPVAGESWTYEVKVTLDPSARLPEGIIEKGPEGVKMEYVKKRTYRGIQKLGENGEEVQYFEVQRDKEKPEKEYVIISPLSIEAKGWEDGSGQKVILEKPLTLWSAKAKPGDSWLFALPDPARPGGPPLMARQFLYFGEETIEVLGKKMKARHMQMEGNTDRLILRHDYWFTDGLGYVMERRSYFLNGRRISVMEETLIEHQKP